MYLCGMDADVRTFRRVFSISVLFCAFVAASPAALADDWLQFNQDPQHSGNNSKERLIGPDNAGTMGVLFRVQLPDVADGAAAYLSGVQTPAGEKDLLFLTTRAGHIVALDALRGMQIWVRQNPANGLTINNSGRPCYTTASPAVDPNRRFVYSYGLEGYVHKYRVGDGEEVKGDGWPELTSLKPWDEKGSSDLTIAIDSHGTPRLYVTHAGYPGDRGDYQGHVTTINLQDGSQNVFNANCSDRSVHFGPPPEAGCPSVQTGIWGRGGVVYDAGLDRIFTATGNGPFEPSHHDWGDSVLALPPDGTTQEGKPLDSYTPENFQYLDDSDTDLGSTIPAILPPIQGSNFAHAGIQSGKDALVRLLDLSNLSGSSGVGHLRGEINVIPVPQGGQVLTAPAVWKDPADGSCWVFIANSRGISGVQIIAQQNGALRMIPRWTKEGGGTSPIIANNVLFYAGSSQLRALRPRDGRVLWENLDIARIHWESPIVVNGRLYMTDESGALVAFGPGK
jgi:outer membrane protein assembly factor BamB